LAPYLRACRRDVELEVRAGAQGGLVATVVIRGETPRKLVGEVAAAIELGPQQTLEHQIGELRAQAAAQRIERQRTVEVAGCNAVLARLAPRELLDLVPRRLALGPAMRIEQAERADARGVALPAELLGIVERGARRAYLLGDDPLELTARACPHGEPDD